MKSVGWSITLCPWWPISYSRVLDPDQSLDRQAQIFFDLAWKYIEDPKSAFRKACLSKSTLPGPVHTQTNSFVSLSPPLWLNPWQAGPNFSWRWKVYIVSSQNRSQNCLPGWLSHMVAYAVVGSPTNSPNEAWDMWQCMYLSENGHVWFSNVQEGPWEISCPSGQMLARARRASAWDRGRISVVGNTCLPELELHKVPFWEKEEIPKKT